MNPAVRWPTEAIVSVTNRCDARCSMCNIWQLDRQEWLRADDYRRVMPTSLRNVNLTGGEPLLRPDIVELVQAIHEAVPRARMILATNGFRTAHTLKTIARIRDFLPNLGIAVSLDGDAVTHDRMRGVPHAHRQAIETLRALREAGVRDMRIGFTATPANLAQLRKVYELSRQLGVEFTATVAQNSEVYYATDHNERLDIEAVERHFGDLVRERLHSGSPKNWLRAYFDHGVAHFVRTGERLFSCDAASGFFFLAPTGEVYPCLTLNQPLGNVRERSFKDIWMGAKARAIRGEVSGCRQCWMMCTARTELRRQPVKVAKWLVREGLSARFGPAPGVSRET